MDRFLERELGRLLTPIVDAPPPRRRGSRSQAYLAIVPALAPDLVATQVVVVADVQATPLLT